jgi:hypothetical protein
VLVARHRAIGGVLTPPVVSVHKRRQLNVG